MVHIKRLDEMKPAGGNRTPVVIRKEDDGQVVAFFPEQVHGGSIGCYSHVGQHSDALINYMLKDTYDITTNDSPKVEVLMNELRRIGYSDPYLVKAEDAGLDSAR